MGYIPISGRIILLQMALISGNRLGPYEILSAAGAGGMGEVYRARDTRLERTVAIKILPEQFSSDPVRKQRFEREAKTISSLNHPHICTLYDIGHQDGTDFLVMEHLEGETLAKRLEKGPLSTAELSRIAIEIASALEKAHRQGILHRDLKPGNIMLTPSGAKLLDFGLAKLVAPLASLTTLTASKPELPVTEQGTIVGTFQYMSPEQMEGKDADARSDIFSIGAVLFEMATGRHAFDGKTKASVIAAILEREPPSISQLQPTSPPALDRTVRSCLAKDPDERFQSAHDLKLQLEWIRDAGSQASVPAPVVARRRSRERIAWALAGTGLLVAVALAFLFARLYLHQPKPSVARFLISPPENANFGSISLSPDGRRLAFVGISEDGRGQLWLRPLDNPSAQPLPGTDGARLPFWSPDSRNLGFFADGSLKKIDVTGGPAQALCAAPVGLGGSWNADGEIVFAPSNAAPLWRVSQSGAASTPLTTLDRSRGESGHVFPWFLPDGRHFLYVASADSTSDRRLCVGSLDSKETKCLLKVGPLVMYAKPGDLLYERAGTLMAQPFDAERLRVTGDAVPIAEHVVPSTFRTFLPSQLTQVASVSQNGVLAYASGSPEQARLQWYDRGGKKQGTVGQPAEYTNPALSPDGTRVTVGIYDAQADSRDLWVFDLKRGTASRFTSGPADELNPLWSRDGSRILFTSNQKGVRDIYQKPANGLGDSELVFESKDHGKSVNDWSPDGRYVLYDTAGAPSGIWVLPLFGDHKPFPLVQGAYVARSAQFSPNGRYVAYASNESGDFEIYVQTFPDHSGKWQVSTAGGIDPEWRRDGKELFFIAGEKLMAVDVKTDGPQFEASIPKPLFQAHFLTGNWRNRYVVAADGQRFLAVVPVEQQASSRITAVMNWTADLKR